MRKQIPNLITLLNLFSGCVALTMAFRGAFAAVVMWVLIAALLDFFDGMAARLLNAHSDIGKELDSLADLVSFGVAPAAALHVLLRDHLRTAVVPVEVAQLIPYLAFMIPLFSAYRLAKFNLDERQRNSFLGLPTPANALFWISYCYGTWQLTPSDHLLLYLTLVLLLALSFLMVSEVPMFSLKVSKIDIRKNGIQLTLLLLATLFIAWWGIPGIAWSILTYILLSLLTFRKRKTTS